MPQTPNTWGGLEAGSRESGGRSPGKEMQGWEGWGVGLPAGQRVPVPPGRGTSGVPRPWVSEAPRKYPGLWRALPGGRGWLRPRTDLWEKPCHLLKVAVRKGDTRGPFLFFLLTPRTGGGDTARDMGSSRLAPNKQINRAKQQTAFVKYE